ncbi:MULTISPECIES: type II toxin-antitoxin system RnlA family toxin [Clostridium]|uniref:Type II toxin-antitoxin system RnlA family toxin n=1 Tax=Clostridium frigoriphilum TaxID=443253 RepID=A0ABU7UVG2_9CLOT|nr:type II toxin-antitoxin system RnlA family toxin [Clostridium sp. DSM 17811]MBU3102241.1 type II toxin-antitoxin system RnlA family toxin [Clostridium sp. DSM 17811]
MVDKIKKTMDELMEELEGVCEVEGVSFECEKKHEKLTQVNLNNNSILRIYNTKKGLKIDDSIVQDGELANRIVNKWKELYYVKVENKNYTYKNVKNPTNIKDELIGLDEGDYIVSDGDAKGNGCIFSIVIADHIVHEKVTVNFYNTNNLLVQGYTGNLWERVCRIVELNNECDVKDILKRIETDALNIRENKVDDFSSFEKNLKENLTEDVYNFLSVEDREYLLSAQILIDQEIKFPRYNTVLCPAALSIEGFFKKLLVKLEIVKRCEVADCRFKFGIIFNDRHRLLDSKYKDMRVAEEDKKEVKATIERLYTKIKAFRNPANHSSGGMGTNILNVRTFERCKGIYNNDVISFIKNSYYNVYKKDFI